MRSTEAHGYLSSGRPTVGQQQQRLRPRDAVSVRHVLVLCRLLRDQRSAVQYGYAHAVRPGPADVAAGVAHRWSAYHVRLLLYRSDHRHHAQLSCACSDRNRSRLPGSSDLLRPDQQSPPFRHLVCGIDTRALNRRARRHTGDKRRHRRAATLHHTVGRHQPQHCRGQHSVFRCLHCHAVDRSACVLFCASLVHCIVRDAHSSVVLSLCDTCGWRAVRQLGVLVLSLCGGRQCGAQLGSDPAERHGSSDHRRLLCQQRHGVQRRSCHADRQCASWCLQRYVDNFHLGLHQATHTDSAHRRSHRRLALPADLWRLCGRVCDRHRPAVLPQLVRLGHVPPQPIAVRVGRHCDSPQRLRCRAVHRARPAARRCVRGAAVVRWRHVRRSAGVVPSPSSGSADCGGRQLEPGCCQCVPCGCQQRTARRHRQHVVCCRLQRRRRADHIVDRRDQRVDIQRPAGG